MSCKKIGSSPYADLYGGLLNWKAKKYISLLEIKGFQCKQIMYRDFMVKLEIKDSSGHCGYIKIYYSPNKKSFKLVTDEIFETAHIKLLSILWKDINLPSKKKYKPKKAVVTW